MKFVSGRRGRRSLRYYNGNKIKIVGCGVLDVPKRGGKNNVDGFNFE